MNLLQETINSLKINNKLPTNVLWIGNNNVWFTWLEFSKIADVEYDNGYGSPEVAIDLMVVGDGWWLEREEYDGSEWWSYKKLPQKPIQHKVPETLVGGMWRTLEDLNK